MGSNPALRKSGLEGTLSDQGRAEEALPTEVSMPQIILAQTQKAK